MGKYCSVAFTWMATPTLKLTAILLLNVTELKTRTTLYSITMKVLLRSFYKNGYSTFLVQLHRIRPTILTCSKANYSWRWNLKLPGNYFSFKRIKNFVLSLSPEGVLAALLWRCWPPNPRGQNLSQWRRCLRLQRSSQSPHDRLIYQKMLGSLLNQLLSSTFLY